MKIDRRNFLLTSAMTFASQVLPLESSNARVMVGQSLQLNNYTVTALLDGVIKLDPSVFQQATQEEIASLAVLAGQNASVSPVSVTAYLLERDGHIALVDAGSGNFLGSDLGNISELLKLRKIVPQQIDSVLLTHAHPDHLGGLLDSNRKIQFPSAKLFIDHREAAFWKRSNVRDFLPKGAEFFADIANQVLDVYADRTETFRTGDKLFPGLHSIDIAGHTPGHNAFAVGDLHQNVTICGDIVTAPAYQFARPDWTTPYDIDEMMAVSARLSLFNKFASSGNIVAGMHFDYPGFGTIQKDGSSFHFTALT